MCGGQLCGKKNVNHRADDPDIKRLIRLRFNVDTNLSMKDLAGILRRKLVPPPSPPPGKNPQE
jgi:hypothetical protein